MQEITLPSLDGRTIPATLFRAAAAAGEPREPVVVACATGAPQRFYRGFAEFAAERGRDVVTFDYRGLGRARPARLRGFEAGFLDWAQEIDSVVAWASQYGPVDLVGHSFGAQALGHLTHKDRVRSLVAFGMGSGHHSYMARGEQVKVQLLWHGLGPILSAAYGYLPSSLVGLGEDLPRGVYRDWKRWCGFPRYWFSDPSVDFHDRFAAVRARILNVTTEDDAWAPDSSADMFASHYTNAAVEKLRLVPAELGLKSIGHMGFFRRDVGPHVWPKVLAWWEQNGVRPRAQAVPVGAHGR
ncbi:MAG: alpha/beta fold hydrolase [Verrucomicrobia bacterium]|nr:alpha/beta fold hydrolase [Verrucomicrobiota bacterium]